MLRFLLLTVFFAFLVAQMAGAIVKYDEGRMEINGIQLFQDSENARAYYYLPPYPRVSVGEVIVRFLNHIGGTCRKVLTLAFYRNFSMESIASELNFKSESVAKKKKQVMIPAPRRRLPTDQNWIN